MSHYSNSTTIDRMIEESRDYDAMKTDFGDGFKPDFVQGKVVMDQYHDNLNDKDVVVGPYGITDHALYQICARFGPGTFGKGSAKMLPYDAMRQWLDNPSFAPHASAILNDHVDALNPKLLMRAYDNNIRAVLSDRYAVLDNTTILEMVRDAFNGLEEKAGRKIKVEVYQSSVTPDDLHMHYRVMGADVLPPGESGPYAFGGVITNGETGKIRIKMLPSLFRGPCTNTLYFDDGNDMAVNMRHYGQNLILRDRVALAIASSVQLGGQYLNRMMQAKQAEIPDLFAAITKLAESENWSTEIADAVRTGTEGQRNLWGLVNGVTYAAHTQYADKPEAQFEMEARAGSWLLHPPKIREMATVRTLHEVDEN